MAVDYDAIRDAAETMAGRALMMCVAHVISEPQKREVEDAIDRAYDAMFERLLNAVPNFDEGREFAQVIFDRIISSALVVLKEP
jgi:hypothetical protein